ncbi:MAG: M3 family oligoendopeptidase [Bacillota bacterium]
MNPNVGSASEFKFDSFQADFEKLLNEFHQVKELVTSERILREINNLRLEYEAAKNLATLIHVQDYHNLQASAAYQKFMANEPIYLELVNKYYRSLLISPHKEEHEKKWGKQLFRLAQVKVNSYREEITEELDLEINLMEEYGKLLGTAEVNYQGKKMPLSALGQYMASSDREIRRSAWQTRGEFFENNEEEFDRILDSLIKVRNTISKKLGRESFIEIGYERMNRTDITPLDFEIYRKQIRNYGVGFVTTLRERQKHTLGLETLKYYDDKIIFEEGPPSLKVSSNQFLESMQNLFKELSVETESFSNALLGEGYHDLYPRTGKQGGGYATYLGREKKPFIFANFTGIANDVRVFTHEAGHAFQFYMSRKLDCPEYIIPVDSAEIFSFSMERFAWPWMDKFFHEDARKYIYSHMAEGFMYMPLANAVDEFEHYIYQEPKASPKERRQKWRELEKSYLPELDYDDNKYLDNGGGFHGIAHIFLSPFYFIDYDLAHFVAVQLWIKALHAPETAWNSYLEMCKSGGSRSFKEHIKAAGLISPFEENSLAGIIEFVEEWMNHQQNLTE